MADRMRAVVMVAAAAAVYAILNPVRGMDQRQWQEVVWIYGGMTVALVYLSRSSVWLQMFGAWAVVVAAAHRTMDSLQAMLVLAGAFGLVAAAGAAPMVARKVLVWLAMANAAIMGLQLVGAWEFIVHVISPVGGVTIHNQHRILTGLTGSTADVAVLLAVALPLVWTWWQAVIIFLGLVGAMSLVGMVAGIVGAALAAWAVVDRWDEVKRGLAVMGAVMCAGCVGAVDHLMSSLSDDRWLVWVVSIGRTFDGSWIVGHGWGSWVRQMPLFLSPTQGVSQWPAAHNEYVQAFHELGIIGLCLGMAALAAAAWRSSWRARGALAAVAVVSFGHFSLRVAAGGVAVALALGYALGEQGDESCGS
jgi:hypothetical protein